LRRAAITITSHATSTVIPMTRPALLNPTYWPEVQRGTERYIHDLAAGLMAMGDEPELLTSRLGEPGREVIDGLPVTFSRRYRDAWLRRHQFDDYWTHVPATFRALSRGTYDLAHAFYPTDALAAALWSRRSGHPSIFSVMGIPNPLIKIRFDSQPRAARRCDVVTVDSRAVADAFFYRWGIRTKVVYPGVDLKTFAPATERDGSPLIFCPAPIEIARKRVDWLIRAMPAVRHDHPGARLLLLRPQSRDVVSRLERECPGIEFFGGVTHASELAGLYSRAWVTALPAWGEAFGMVLIESLACGTPVVAARRDAFPEIVDRAEVGSLFDDSDPSNLEGSLIEALAIAKDPRVSEACREHAARFSAERVVDTFRAIYDDLL
jgi:glycosyltransferase involved in cell wall biosynthesis